MEVYTVIVIWKDDDIEMQPFAFDSIDKMINFRNEALMNREIKEVKCHMLTVK